MKPNKITKKEKKKKLPLEIAKSLLQLSLHKAQLCNYEKLILSNRATKSLEIGVLQSLLISGRFNLLISVVLLKFNRQKPLAILHAHEVFDRLS